MTWLLAFWMSLIICWLSVALLQLCACLSRFQKHKRVSNFKIASLSFLTRMADILVSTSLWWSSIWRRTCLWFHRLLMIAPSQWPLRESGTLYCCPSRRYQWCGLRPSVLGQDRSETKNRSWSWSCRSGVVLWNTVLSRSSSYWSWRTQQLFTYYIISLFMLGTSLLWRSTVAFTYLRVISAKCLSLLPVTEYWNYYFGLGLGRRPTLRP